MQSGQNATVRLDGRALRGRIGSGLAAALALLACSSPTGHQPLTCDHQSNGCVCTFQPATSGAVTSCDPSVLPQSQCCADPRWPSNGECECVTSGIFCGVVPGYEPGTGGAPGEDACACEIGPDPRSSTQVIGATCNSNGTTTAGPGLGICCMFSGAAPGSLGGLACVCAAGLHTCGTGGVQVTSCSVANFPPPAPGCDQGRTQVAKCM